MIFIHFGVNFDKLKKTFFQYFPRENPSYNPEETWAVSQRLTSCWLDFASFGSEKFIQSLFSVN